VADSNYFQVRNRFHEIEGTLSKQEILQAIQSGRLTGEEEVSQPPFEKWQKIASHPDFYDALLKKIFNDQYQAPAAPPAPIARVPKAKPRVERGTRQAELSRAHTQRLPEEGEDAGKTRQLHDVKDAGKTWHQSDIDALFRDGGQSRTGGKLVPAQKTEVNPLLVPLAEPTIELKEGRHSPTAAHIDTALGPAEPEVVAALERKRKIDKRRKVMWGAALALILILLFQMGGETPKAPVEKDSSSLISRQWLNDTSTREELLQTLIEEADSLAQSDTPLFYQGALDVLKEAFGYDESNPASHGKYAEYESFLLPNSRHSDELIADINSKIAAGRVADPNYSQFFRAEARTAIFQKKFDDAKQAALHAAETDPTNPENYLLVGELHRATGDLAQASWALNQAVKGLPNSVRAHYLLAKTSFDQNDLARAQSEALEALRLNPLHPATYLLLARIAQAGNNLKEAKGLFETCGRLARFAPREVAGQSYLELGKLQEMTGNTKQAEDSLRLAYFYLPERGAELKKKVANLDISSASLKKLADEEEYDSSYFMEQGDGLLGQGKLGEAIRFYEAARLLDPNSAAPLIKLGDVTEKTAASYGDFRRVMLLYQRAIEKEPTNAAGYIKLGTLETEQYNFDRGLKLLNQAVALSPQTAEPYVALGKHFYKRQDYNEALNQFLKAAKINPSDSEVLYYAGLLRLLFKKEGMKDAVRFFYQAYTLNPQNYDALVEWLKLKVQNYEKNFAIKFVRNLMDAEPGNPNLQWVMGEVYAASKEYRRAITYYHAALDLDNRASKVRMSLARALESVGELDKAVAEFRLASLLDRRNSEGFYHAADLLFQMKSYNQAEEVLKFLVSVSPNYPGAERYLSKIYQVRKQKDLAITAMQKEVQNNPENYKFVIELAELYMEYERYDDAVKELTKVANLPSLSKAPEFVYDKIRGYLLLSRCYRAKNELDSAEGAIKLALEIDSNDPELHRELGYVYYAEQRDKEGVKAFQYYLTKNPAARDADTIRGLISKMQIDD
jgi:tetratricopeptide (TPR) repeat protein